MKVLVIRFLKTENSGEVEVLRSIPGITVPPCERTFGFVFRMTEEQKQEAALYYQSRFEAAAKKAVQGQYDLLILDEILASCNYGMVRETSVVEFLQNRPEKLEVVLTGRNRQRHFWNWQTMYLKSVCAGTLMRKEFRPAGESNLVIAFAAAI